MRLSTAIIERMRHIGDGWQHLVIKIDDPAFLQLEPGQSLLVKRDGSQASYLRELWLPVDVDPDAQHIIIERSGTDELSPGATIDILGPIGKPLPLFPATRQLLLIAHDYPPTRLRFLLARALQNSCEVTLVLTGEYQDYAVSSLPAQTEVIYSAEALAWPSFDQTILWADQIFVVTAPHLIDDYYQQLAFLTKDLRHALPEHYLNGIFDLSLPCGLGGCFACMVGTRLACLEGPAFDIARMRF